jgi:hypothetical protein
MITSGDDVENMAIDSMKTAGPRGVELGNADDEMPTGQVRKISGFQGRSDIDDIQRVRIGQMG